MAVAIPHNKPTGGTEQMFNCYYMSHKCKPGVVCLQTPVFYMKFYTILYIEREGEGEGAVYYPAIPLDNC